MTHTYSISESIVHSVWIDIITQYKTTKKKIKTNKKTVIKILGHGEKIIEKNSTAKGCFMITRGTASLMDGNERVDTYTAGTFLCYEFLSKTLAKCDYVV